MVSYRKVINKKLQCSIEKEMLDPIQVEREAVQDKWLAQHSLQVLLESRCKQIPDETVSKGELQEKGGLENKVDRG